MIDDSRAGGIPIRSMLIMAPTLAMIFSGGLGESAVDGLLYDASSGPAPIGGKAVAISETAFGESRPRAERNAHWSSNGSKLDGSRNIVV